MSFSHELVEGLNIAMNEATCRGLEFDPQRAILGTTFEVLTLPESGPPSQDRRVQILFGTVGRLAARLLVGSQEQPYSTPVRFEAQDLLSISQEYAAMSIYGWQFINQDDSRIFAGWSDRLSLDYRSDGSGMDNTLDLAFVDSMRDFRLRIWFSEILIRNPAGEVVPVEEFIAGGKRWWNAFNNGDPRSEGMGMYPLK
jgi:hypothetical protein